VHSKIPGWCYFNDKGNEILLRINISPPLNDHWLGQGGPMAWPPRSPDLTPLDFFLWGHVKAPIYILPPDSEEDLIACVAEAAATWHF
jgi:hypothetical protein